MSICDELEDLIPAYVLGALNADERARVEKHLPECANLSELAAAYGRVAELLPHAATPVEPRAELKERVLAAARHFAVPKKKAVFAWPSFFTEFLRSPAFAVMTILLILALGVWNITLQNQMAQEKAFEQRVLTDLSRQRDFLNVIAYSDDKPKRLQGTEAASRAAGRLYSAPNENTFALILNDLPPLPPDKVYQVWLIDAEGKRVSGGTFRVDERGRGWLWGRAADLLNQYRAVGITIEPLGGSPQPTGVRVAVGDL